MELRYYFILFRRWVWLLILGLVLGGATANIASIYQTSVYQASTKIMVMRAPEERSSEYTALNEFQLARTYSQLIVTEPVLQALSDELGFNVSANQITVRQQADSLIVALTVEDEDPQRAALIANTLVGVFILYNENLQVSRFASSEESLKAQIDSVNAQITALQQEMSQVSEESLKSQQTQVQEQIKNLEAEISQAKAEIAALTPPTPAPAPAGGLGEGVTPEPTVTPDPVKAATVEEKQRQLDQLQSTYNLYQQVYLNLLVLGQSTGNGNQNLRLNQLQTTLALYQQIYSNLLNNYENVRLARLRSTPNVVQIEQARTPNTPIRPQPVRNAALGAATGLLIMGAIAFLIEYLDDTIKTPEDVARTLNLPVIGLIGKIHLKKDEVPGTYVAEKPRSPVAEAFRTLRTNLDFAGMGRPLKTILISSPGPGDGKTTLAVNLAITMAQGERKVILLDADLRRPSIHRFMQIVNRSGLTDIFRNTDHNLGDILPWGELPLGIITSGSLPPNPTELMGSDKMSEILDELKQKADIVIIDSPPFIVADPAVLAAKVDAVVMVIEPGETKIDSAQAMLEQLQRSNARVVGVVLNGISRNRAYYYGKYHYYSDYYYSHGYGYYSPSEAGDKSKKSAKNNKQGASTNDRPESRSSLGRRTKRR